MASSFKTSRKAGIRSLKVGDMVRIVRVGPAYCGPGSGEVMATVAVVKVLAGFVRVAWSEYGKATTDFSRDTGRAAKERRWTGYPVIDVEGATTVGPAY